MEMFGRDLLRGVGEGHVAGRNDQSSTSNAGTRLNSRKLAVAIRRPWVRQAAASRGARWPSRPRGRTSPLPAPGSALPGPRDPFHSRSGLPRISVWERRNGVPRIPHIPSQRLRIFGGQPRNSLEEGRKITQPPTPRGSISARWSSVGRQELSPSSRRVTRRSISTWEARSNSRRS